MSWQGGWEGSSHPWPSHWPSAGPLRCLWALWGWWWLQLALECESKHIAQPPALWRPRGKNKRQPLAQGGQWGGVPRQHTPPPPVPPQQSQDRVLSGSLPHLAAPSSLAWAQRCPGADPVKPLVPFEVVFGFGNGGFAQDPGAGAQSRSRAAYQGPQAGYRGFVPETWGCRAGHDV